MKDMAAALLMSPFALLTSHVVAAGLNGAIA